MQILHIFITLDLPSVRGVRLYHSQALHAAHAKQTQPAKKDNPPSGVIIPSHLVPLTLIRYRLPEKRTVPMTKSHPPVVISEEGHFDCIQAAAISAKA